MIRRQIFYDFTFRIIEKLPDLAQHMGIDMEYAIGDMLDIYNHYTFPIIQDATNIILAHINDDQYDPDYEYIKYA